jgi:hypothetical protein
MANCEPCTAEKHSNVAAVAQCEHPAHNGNYWICTHPNTIRADHRFHGERCGCDCDAMYCRPHARLHAQTHSSGRVCFPNFGFTAAGPALGASAARLGAPDMPGSIREKSEILMSAFLAEIQPGMDAIEAAAQGTNLVISNSRSSDSGGELPKLSPTFFSQARLASIAALAANTIARTAQRLRKGVAASVGLNIGSDRVVQALYELTDWSSGGDLPSEESLALLAQELWNERTPSDWASAARRIRRKLFLLDIPHTDDELATWLVWQQ